MLAVSTALIYIQMGPAGAAGKTEAAKRQREEAEHAYTQHGEL